MNILKNLKHPSEPLIMHSQSQMMKIMMKDHPREFIKAGPKPFIYSFHMELHHFHPYDLSMDLVEMNNL
jgi:hypothetical protein